jgi:DNA-binding NarL/FixJ family response regulator
MTHPPLDPNPGRRTTQFERPSTSVSLDAYSDLTSRHVGEGTRAIIASGLRLLRDGLADALMRSTTISVVTSVGSADHARAAIIECEPDVLLLDIEMPGGLALVHAIHDAPPSPKVVAFAVSDSDAALVDYIEAGIAGYVTRDGSLSEIVATVESVGRGETIVSPRIAASLFQRLAEQRRRNVVVATAAPSELTSREAQILGLIEQGMANKEIARTLGIELATVKNHVHHVLEKLKVARRGQAAARARSTTHGRPA